MTQEDKLLLLKDLCARLPYGVQLRIDDDEYPKLWRVESDAINGYSIDRFEIKPYLRPMSSMTEEENKRYDDILTKMYYHEKSTLGDISDYLNSIHVDYRGLIPKGLAIEVTKENNPYKN